MPEFDFTGLEKQESYDFSGLEVAYPDAPLRWEETEAGKEAVGELTTGAPYKWEDIKDEIPEHLHKKTQNALSIASTYDINPSEAYKLVEKFEEQYGEKNIYDKARGSFKAGIGDMYSSMGHAGKWAGFEGMDIFIDYGENLRKAYIPPVYHPPFSYKSVTDPEWWATTAIRPVPASLSLIPAAVVAAYGGAAIATGAAAAVGLGVFGTTVLETIGGAGAAAIVSRPLESAMEAGGAREAAIEAGKTEYEADEIAETVFKKNLALAGIDATQFALAFSPLKLPGKSAQTTTINRILSIAGKGAVVVGAEGAEERYQELIQMQALEKRGEFFANDPRLNEATVVGGIFGAGLAGAGSVWTSLKSSITETMPEDVKAQYETAFRESTLPEEQAELEALDAIAATPEGEVHIKQVLEYLKDPPSAPSEVMIIGVDESPEGEPISYTMADRETGETFTVPVGATAKDVQEALDVIREPDELDVIIRGEEDIDVMADRLVGEEVVEPEITPETGRAFIIEDAVAAIAKTKTFNQAKPHLQNIANTIIETGQTLKGFTSRMKEALGKAFTRFKTKMKELYDSAKKTIGKPLTGAERGAIELGRVGEFKKEDLLEYEKIAGEIDRKAEEELAKQYTKEKKKYLKDALARARKEIKESQVFASKDEAVRLGGISYEQLSVDYGAEAISELQRGRPGIVSRKSNISPDEFASDNGYATLDEMVEDWLAAGSKREAIIKLAENIYAEEFEAFEGEAKEIAFFEDLLEAREDVGKKVLQDPRIAKRADKTLKRAIREATGQVKEEPMVRERVALKASFTKAAQAARVAFREGKREELAKQKAIMKEAISKVKERAEVKIGKVKTAKEIVQNRRNQIKNIRDYFGLTDNDLRKVSKKDIRLMSNWEFKQFKDDIHAKAVELVDTQIAKATLMQTIFENRLGKVENYRRALDLPAISKMTTQQLNEFNEILQEFQPGDVFLTQREIEVVDRTDLEGIRTWREARERLAKESGVPVEELEKIKVHKLDSFRWDTSLADRNAFYWLLVNQVNKSMMGAEIKAHEVENKVFGLARKSEESRGLKWTEKAIPQDEQIFNYLEAKTEEKDALAVEMTPEQLDYAHYIQEYFGQALDYLIETKALEKGRENYFVHMRRTFLETLKADGLMTAVKDMFKNYEQDQMVFGILDDDTGNILPLEKFFQFAMQRTGELTPTKNITRAFLTYVNTLEKKKSLDEIIPKMDIYAQSLTPTRYTPRGLEIDRSLKKFVNKYINNKKGRRISFDGVIKQGGEIDVSIAALRTFITMLDLGLNIPVGLASFVGEQAATFAMLGPEKQALGTKRMATKKGQKIIKQNEAYIGRSLWEEFTAPGKELPQRLAYGLFGLFHVSSVTANKQFLLGSMTDEEWKSGKINAERLAELKLEMGRMRKVPGSESLVGSTSAGKAAVQYKSWAVPIIRTLSKDVATIARDLKAKPPGEALSTREAKEIYRAIGLTATVLMVGSMGSVDDDRSFVGQLKKKIYREAMTLMQGIDPKLWLSVPRILTFLAKLGNNLNSLVTLEEYKSKELRGQLKGPRRLRQQFTPRFLKQLAPEKKKKARPVRKKISAKTERLTSLTKENQKKKTIARTGTDKTSGRRVVEYEDGTVAYAA